MRKRGKNVKQRDARSRRIKKENLIGDTLRALDVEILLSRLVTQTSFMQLYLKKLFQKSEILES